MHTKPDKMSILTRNGYDWTDRFPSIVASARALMPQTMILDGKVVVLDDERRSDFGCCRKRSVAAASQAIMRA